MTVRTEKLCKTRRSLPLIGRLIQPLIFFGALILSILFPGEMRAGVIDGIELSVFTVIPAVFPFMVLSDFVACSGSFDGGAVSWAVRKLLGLSHRSGGAMICGNLCGFPMGAKITMDQYRRGEITQEEAERALAPATNPSFAFVVSGIGGGMLHCVTDGLILYFGIIIATVLTGIIYSHKHIELRETSVNTRQSYDFTRSIKDAAINSVYVGGFVIFFSFIIMALRAVVKNEICVTFVSTVLEITNSARGLIAICSIRELLLPLLAFSLGFSGMSVHMQVSALVGGEVDMRLYYVEKLTEGMLCAFIVYALVLLL